MKLIKIKSKAHEIHPLISRVVNTTIQKAMSEIPDKDIDRTKSVLEKIIMNISRFHES